MDGSKPLLRHLFIASLALISPAAVTRADDFIRQPTNNKPPVAASTAKSTQRVASKTVAFPLKLRSRSADTQRSVAIHQPVNAGTPKNFITPPARSNATGSHHASNQSIVNTEQLSRPAESRSELAARISSELLTDPSGGPGLIAPSSLEPGPGWQAVGGELKQHLSQCEALLARNAYLSAREEANRAILSLTRALDLRQNKLTSEPAWAQAQQALREAQDFTTLERIANDSELFNRLIQSHETPALRGVSVAELTPLAAAQHYRAYAEKCLVEASQGHPWFSELYYCIGRTHQAQSEAGDPQKDALLQQSLTFYRSAYAIQPTNATNASQLGFVLLRMDRPAEAFTRLSEAVRLPECPLEGWQNLVQASTQVGDQNTAQWAAQRYMALKANGQQPSGPPNTLVEVDPMQFVAMSPRNSGPRPGLASEQSSATSAAQTQTAAPAARTANTPRKGFFR